MRFSFFISSVTASQNKALAFHRKRPCWRKTLLSWRRWHEKWQSNDKPAFLCFFYEQLCLLFQAHQQCIQQCVKEIEQLYKQADVKSKKTSTLELQLPDIRVDVAQLRHVSEAAGWFLIDKHSPNADSVIPDEHKYLSALKLLLFWLFRPWTRASKSQRAAPGACCEKQLEGSSQSSGWGTDSPFSGSWTSNEEELHFSLSAEIQLSETFFLFLNWAKSSLYIKCAFAVKNLQQIKWLRTT